MTNLTHDDILGRRYQFIQMGLVDALAEFFAEHNNCQRETLRRYLATRKPNLSPNRNPECDTLWALYL